LKDKRLPSHSLLKLFSFFFALIGSPFLPLSCVFTTRSACFFLAVFPYPFVFFLPARSVNFLRPPPPPPNHRLRSLLLLDFASSYSFVLPPADDVQKPERPVPDPRSSRQQKSSRVLLGRPFSLFFPRNSFFSFLLFSRGTTGASCSVLPSAPIASLSPSSCQVGAPSSPHCTSFSRGAGVPWFFSSGQCCACLFPFSSFGQYTSFSPSGGLDVPQRHHPFFRAHPFSGVKSYHASPPPLLLVSLFRPPLSLPICPRHFLSERPSETFLSPPSSGHLSAWTFARVFRPFYFF